MKSLAQGLAFRRVAWTLLGLFMGYLAVVNVALNVGLLPHLINGKPEALEMNWKVAVSPWPGVAWVRGYRLRVQDSSVQWEVNVDHATTRVALLSLFHHEFKTHWVHASGVTFHFRPKMERDEVTDARAEALPSIPGFPDNFKEDEPESSPNPADKPWSVRLEDVSVADAKDVWLGPYRALLDVRIHGRFQLRPHHLLQVGPATVDFLGGEVRQGVKLPVLESLKGHATVQFEVKDWGAGAAKGEDILKEMNADLALQAKLVSVRALNYHLRGQLHPEVEGGAAVFQLKAAVEHGRLAEGSHLRFDGEPWRGSMGTFFLGGSWSAHAEVTGEKEGRVSTGEFVASPLYVENDAGHKLLESPALKVSVRAHDVVLGQPLEDASVRLMLSPTQPIPLRKMNGFISGKAFDIESGAAVLRADVTFGVGKRRGSGSLVLETDRVWTQWGKARLSGNLAAAVDLDRVRLDRESASLSGTSVHLKDVAVFSPQGERHGWDGNVSLDEARLSLKPALTLKTHVHGTFSDARPFLALFGAQAGLPKLLTPFLAAKNLQVHGKLLVAGKAIRASELLATGEHLSIAGDMSVNHDATEGVFLCKVHGLPVGLKVAPGKVTPQLFGTDDWFKKEVAARH